MAVALPTSPGPLSIKAKPLRASNDLQSPLGGKTQRINRLGDRFIFEVTMPPMDRDVAEVWIADLLQGIGSSVSLEWPQPLGGVGAPGTPVVNGAGQAGMAMNLRGFSNGYVLKKGRFVSLVSGGRRQMVNISAQATASAGGFAAVQFWPMLRFSPVDGAAVEVAQPIIEGLLQDDFDGWTLEVAETTGLTFTIAEN